MKKCLIPICLSLAFLSVSASAAPMGTDNLVASPQMSVDTVKKKAGKLLEILIVANSNEMDTGKIAIKRASHPDVKKFAALMIQEHGQNLQDTKKLANTLNVTPAASDKSDMLVTKGKKELNRLESAPARRFDKVYMEAMVEGHKKLLDLIDKDLLPNSVNPEMITHLEATRDKVKAHLEMAKQIQSTL